MVLRTCVEECMDFYVILLPPSVIGQIPRCETGIHVPGNPAEDGSQGQGREGEDVSFWGET